MLDIFNPKVSTIEELNNLKTLPIDQLLGTLTAYEMRISKDKSTTRETSFKVDKKIDSERDVIEEKIVRRLKKGVMSRFKNSQQRKNFRKFVLTSLDCGDSNGSSGSRIL